MDLVFVTQRGGRELRLQATSIWMFHVMFLSLHVCLPLDFGRCREKPGEFSHMLTKISCVYK